jgi:hypothetical protein
MDGNALTIFARCKNELKLFNDPKSIDEACCDVSFQCTNNPTAQLRFSPQFSMDGNFVVLVNESNTSPIKVIRCSDMTLFCEVQCFNAQYLEFSPLSSFLLTWSRPNDTGIFYYDLKYFGT